MQVMKHCGATTVPRPQLDRNPTVPITASHNPLNHSILPNMVEAKLAEFGWTVRDFDAGLSHGGKRAFWLMDVDHIDHPIQNPYFSLSIGGRTCWDKTYASGIAGGDHTFVCDNLMLVGEFRMNRKHTTYNLRDLPGMVHDVVSRLNDRFSLLVERNHKYMDKQITIPQAENLIFKAYDCGAVPKSKLSDVREHFLNPPHDIFRLNDVTLLDGVHKVGNIWKLKQAFTEINKGTVYGDQLKRGIALTEVLDGFSGVRSTFSQAEFELN